MYTSRGHTVAWSWYQLPASRKAHGSKRPRGHPHEACLFSTGSCGVPLLTRQAWDDFSSGQCRCAAVAIGAHPWVNYKYRKGFYNRTEDICRFSVVFFSQLVRHKLKIETAKKKNITQCSWTRGCPWSYNVLQLLCGCRESFAVREGCAVQKNRSMSGFMYSTPVFLFQDNHGFHHCSKHR